MSLIWLFLTEHTKASHDFRKVYVNYRQLMQLELSLLIMHRLSKLHLVIKFILHSSMEKKLLLFQLEM